MFLTCFYKKYYAEAVRDVKILRLAARCRANNPAVRKDAVYVQQKKFYFSGPFSDIH